MTKRKKQMDFMERQKAMGDLTIEHNKLTDYQHRGFAFSGEAGNDKKVVESTSTRF